ncbi:hypothetical protein HHI36_006365 [Cryptolaemus montrouzieri]|uniref:Uncharacterized protein n=1 Tax=Cryptolaemus montrouzieri TaxID=559131 RepID=A0ABD2NWY8_9CUCU
MSGRNFNNLQDVHPFSFITWMHKLDILEIYELIFIDAVVRKTRRIYILKNRSFIFFNTRFGLSNNFVLSYCYKSGYPNKLVSVYFKGECVMSPTNQQVQEVQRFFIIFIFHCELNRLMKRI